jgi:hypothetical protein
MVKGKEVDTVSKLLVVGETFNTSLLKESGAELGSAIWEVADFRSWCEAAEGGEEGFGDGEEGGGEIGQEEEVMLKGIRGR